MQEKEAFSNGSRTILCRQQYDLMAHLNMTVFQILAGATVLCIWTVLSMCMRSVCRIPNAVKSSAVVNTNPSLRHVSCTPQNVIFPTLIGMTTACVPAVECKHRHRGFWSGQPISYPYYLLYISEMWGPFRSPCKKSIIRKAQRFLYPNESISEA
jgi:hypothetical protein